MFATVTFSMTSSHGDFYKALFWLHGARPVPFLYFVQVESWLSRRLRNSQKKASRFAYWGEKYLHHSSGAKSKTPTSVPGTTLLLPQNAHNASMCSTMTLESIEAILFLSAGLYFLCLMIQQFRSQ